MKTYKYNTLRGLLRATRGQMTIENLFTGRGYFSNGRGSARFVLSDSARLEAANIFATYLVHTVSRRAGVVSALVAGRGDLSLFQCFYIELSGDQIRCSNSLSGSAFNSCKREYLRRYC